MVGLRKFAFYGLLICLLGQSSHSFAQEVLKEAVIIDSEAGLPNDYITSLVMDSLGFTWIGTEGGLCRYDGSDIKTYTQDPEIPNSLPSDVIT